MWALEREDEIGVFEEDFLEVEVDFIYVERAIVVEKCVEIV